MRRNLILISHRGCDLFFFFFDGTPLTPLVLYIYIYIKVFIHDMQRLPPVFLRRDRRDHYKKIFMIIS